MAAEEASIALQQKRQQERDRQAKLEQEKQAADKAAREKAAAEKAAREQAAKAEAAKRQAQLEADRQKNLERMLGQARATGAASASGNAERAAGPSVSYAGQLVARIRPNIVFTEVVSGNPVATVEVRTLPDGTVLGSKLLQSSGVSAWDQAVLRAIERTGKLPRDDNGRVPSTLILDFRPRD
jgi:colicin import membrane protein